MISVIICTHNRADVLQRSIDSVAKQSLDVSLFEIIVVDNASTDATAQICKANMSLGNFRYVREDTVGLSHARNRGIAEAIGRYVAFLDDDAVASETWLETILRGFEGANPRPGSVGGRILPLWETPRPSWLPDVKLVYLTVLNYGESPLYITYPKILYGANMAFDKELLVKVGGFRTDVGRQRGKLLGGEDSGVFKKFAEQNVPVYYIPEASVQHQVAKERTTKRWLYRRHYWQGRTEMLLLPDGLPRGEIKKQMRHSLKELRRLTKGLFKEAKESGRFTHTADMFQHIGRLVQLLAFYRRANGL